MRFFKQYRPAGEWTIWFAWYPIWAWTGWDDHEEMHLALVWFEHVWRQRNSSKNLCKYKYIVI